MPKHSYWIALIGRLHFAAQIKEELMIEHRPVWYPDEEKVTHAITLLLPDILSIAEEQDVKTLIVGVLAGEDGSLQYHRTFLGHSEKRNDRMIFGKGAVSWERRSPSLDAANLDFDVRELVPEGVNVGGAFPVFCQGHRVAVVVVTGGDHAKFDHPVSEILSKQLEVLVENEYEEFLAAA